jgi:hypothetical protein
VDICGAKLCVNQLVLFFFLFAYVATDVVHIHVGITNVTIVHIGKIYQLFLLLVLQLV